MKRKIFISLFCLAAIVFTANAQSDTTGVKPRPQHSLGASWSYFGFNSTYSKNSDKKTFGTIGINYECRFNRWIGVTGRVGWTHSWFAADANPAYAYPKKDNAILILAGCDVTWLQRGMVELHSAVAAGVDVRVQANDRGTYTTCGFAGQFDAIGVKLNWSHAFIDVSAGWGSIGCISIGAGYKF